jgi:hypothetical protein
MRSGIECLKRNRKNGHQQPLPGSLGKTGHAKADLKIIDGYGSKSTNSDLAGFYLLLYIHQHAGLFRRRTNVNDVFDNKKIVSCQ